MYKRPPKHIQRARLAVLYSIMTLAVVLIASAMVLVVSNYHFNRETGELEQRGLVQFASTPSGATVEIDHKIISSRTSTKSSVQPGERRFAVWRDGYQAWNLTKSIESGDLIWLNYIRLVPNERPVQSFRNYETLDGSLAASSRRSIIVLPDATKPQLRLVDITNNNPTGQMIDLPESTYATPENPEAASTYSLDSWDDGSRYVMMWRHEDGKAAELVVVDTRTPSRSVNVSREFSIGISQAHFSGRSGNILYIVSDGNLRRLNVSEGTVTRSLVSGVADIELYDVDTVTYTSHPHGETGERIMGVYREGDEGPTVLHQTLDGESKISIAVSEYYDTKYTVIAEGRVFKVYTGHPEEDINSLTLLAEHTIDDQIDTVEFNESGSHALLRLGNSFASYGVERKVLSQSDLGAGKGADLFWIDTMHLGLVADNVLTMRDIDGTNVFELNSAAAGQAATLSRNGTYMYSFGQNENGHFFSQRIRMII